MPCCPTQAETMATGMLDQREETKMSEGVGKDRKLQEGSQKCQGENARDAVGGREAFVQNFHLFRDLWLMVSLALLAFELVALVHDARDPGCDREEVDEREGEGGPEKEGQNGGVGPGSKRGEERPGERVE